MGGAPRRLLALARPDAAVFALGLVAAAVLAVSLPLLPRLVVQPLYGEVLARGRLEVLPALLARAAALVLVGAAAQLAQDALFALGAARFGARLRAGVFRAWLEAGARRDGPEASSGGRAARVALDVRELEWFLTHDVGASVSQALTLLVAAGLLVAQSPRLTAGLALAVVPLMLGLAWLGRRVEGAFRDQQDAAESATGRMSEGLALREVVKAFNLEAAVLARFGAANAAQARSGERRAWLSALQAPLSQVAVGAGLVALLALAAAEIRAGRLGVAGLTAYLALLGILVAPMQMLAKNVGKLAAVRAVSRSVEAALALEPEADGGTLDTPASRGEVSLERVTLRYPGEVAPALDSVSLRVAPGEAVAVVGPSGAGKSSLVRLLLRLVEPESGRVLVDGLDATAYRRRALRASFALVPQSPGLFAGTVRENLELVRPGVPEARLWAALELAGVAAEVRAMPLGLDARLGEGGAGVSGGQAQRLSIARALLTDAPVLVLDEPTSALDAHSETQIRRTLAALKGRRSIVVVAHRLSTVSSVDRVVVLEGGRVVEEGEHDALARAGGAYAALLEAGRA